MNSQRPPPSYDVLCYGLICLDQIMQVGAFPKPGDAVPILEEADYLGGEAANVASVLSGLGVNVSLAGNYLGEDADGGFIMRELRKRRLHIDLIKTRSDAKTPRMRLFVPPDGERTFFFPMPPEDFAEALSPSSLSDAKVFSVDTTLPDRFSLTAARLAKEMGLPVIGSDIGLDHPMLSWIDIVVNSGAIRDSHPGKSLEELAWLFFERCGCPVIITDGPNDVVAVDGQNRLQRFKPYTSEQIEVVDTTGAGDAFKAGIIYGFLKAWSLAESIKFAIATGAMNCQKMGAANPISLTEIECLRDRHDAPDTAAGKTTRTMSESS